MTSESVLAAVRARMTPYEQGKEAANIKMIEAFLDERTTFDEFETRYLRAFKDDPTDWPEDLYLILNEIFLDVDAYYPNPSYWDNLTFGEGELWRRVAHALKLLRSVRLVAT